LREALSAYAGERSGYFWVSAKGAQLTRSAFVVGWKSYQAFLVKARECCASRETKDKPDWKDGELRTHDLRHTFCTMLYDAGVDVKRAQYLMEHKSIMVTMKIYTRLSEERKAKSDEAFHAYFSNGSQNGSQITEKKSCTPQSHSYFNILHEGDNLCCTQ